MTPELAEKLMAFLNEMTEEGGEEEGEGEGQGSGGGEGADEKPGPAREPGVGGDTSAQPA
jgi:hypothetical protein